MGRATLCLVCATALVFLTVTIRAAQDQPGNRKLPRQTHDTGVDDDDQLPPGRARRAPRGRTAQSVKVAVRPNGTVVAQLDESFDDALVVGRAADGTLRYTCLHGLPAAKHLAAPRPALPVAEEK